MNKKGPILIFLLVFSGLAVAQPSLVYNLNSGGNHGKFGNPVIHNGKIYFEGDNGTSGLEMFVFDPSLSASSTNPSLVYDLNSSGSGTFLNPIVHNGKIYFQGDNGTTGSELYVFNPDSAASSTNPRLVYDLYSGSTSGFFRNPVAYDGKIYFAGAGSSTGIEMHVFNPDSAGSSTNPRLVYDLGTGSAGDFFNPIVYNGKIYFEGIDGSAGDELCVFDPSLPISSSNPKMLYDLISGSSSGHFNHPIAYDGKIYFEGNNGSTGSEMFVYDPSIDTSSTNPKVVYDLNSGSSSGFFNGPKEFNGKIYFRANVSHGSEIYVYDPTTAASSSNPSLVYDVWSGGSSGNFNYAVVYNSKLYYQGRNSSSGKEMFSYDPSVTASSSNPSLVHNLNSGTNHGEFRNSIVHNGIIYFQGNNGSSGQEMFKYDDNFVCNSSNVIPTAPGKTYTGNFKDTDANGWTHYCASSGELLLSLKIGTSGAVVDEDNVELKLGSYKTYSSLAADGGMIQTNDKGYAMIDRRWNVNPTTQPSSGNVGVRFYFTDDEYDSLDNALLNHGASGAWKSTLSGVTDVVFYKADSGTTDFADPHTVTGTLISNGSTPSTTVWKHTTHGTSDHIAEFEVSSFSGGGGGGGGGGGSSPAGLPVEMIYFTGTRLPGHTVRLNWGTAFEINNSHFVIERSYNGKDFKPIGEVVGAGNSTQVIDYEFLDNTIDENRKMAYYRLNQFDFDGMNDYSNLKKINFLDVQNPTVVNVFPNPFNNAFRVTLPDLEELATISVKDLSGSTIYSITDVQGASTIDLSDYINGVYILEVVQGQSIRNMKVVKY